jgi:putative spermidine/putrescine transport system permease protein
VVAVLFLPGVEERIIPRQMGSGTREQISPTIVAVATVLNLGSVVLLFTLEMLRSRNEPLPGIRN